MPEFHQAVYSKWLTTKDGPIIHGEHCITAASRGIPDEVLRLCQPEAMNLEHGQWHDCAWRPRGGLIGARSFATDQGEWMIFSRQNGYLEAGRGGSLSGGAMRYFTHAHFYAIRLEEWTPFLLPTLARLPTEPRVGSSGRGKYDELPTLTVVAPGQTGGIAPEVLKLPEAWMDQVETLVYALMSGTEVGIQANEKGEDLVAFCQSLLPLLAALPHSVRSRLPIAAGLSTVSRHHQWAIGMGLNLETCVRLGRDYQDAELTSMPAGANYVHWLRSVRGPLRDADQTTVGLARQVDAKWGLVPSPVHAVDMLRLPWAQAACSLHPKIAEDHWIVSELAPFMAGLQETCAEPPKVIENFVAQALEKLWTPAFHEQDGTLTEAARQRLGELRAHSQAWRVDVSCVPAEPGVQLHQVLSGEHRPVLSADLIRHVGGLVLDANTTRNAGNAAHTALAASPPGDEAAWMQALREAKDAHGWWTMWLKEQEVTVLATLLSRWDLDALEANVLPSLADTPLRVGQLWLKDLSEESVWVAIEPLIRATSLAHESRRCSSDLRELVVDSLAKYGASVAFWPVLLAFHRDRLLAATRWRSDQTWLRILADRLMEKNRRTLPEEIAELLLPEGLRLLASARYDVLARRVRQALGIPPDCSDPIAFLQHGSWQEKVLHLANSVASTQNQDGLLYLGAALRVGLAEGLVNPATVAADFALRPVLVWLHALAQGEVGADLPKLVTNSETEVPQGYLFYRLASSMLGGQVFDPSHITKLRGPWELLYATECYFEKHQLFPQLHGDSMAILLDELASLEHSPQSARQAWRNFLEGAAKTYERPTLAGHYSRTGKPLHGHSDMLNLPPSWRIVFAMTLDLEASRNFLQLPDEIEALLNRMSPLTWCRMVRAGCRLGQDFLQDLSFDWGGLCDSSQSMQSIANVRVMSGINCHWSAKFSEADMEDWAFAYQRSNNACRAAIRSLLATLRRWQSALPNDAPHGRLAGCICRLMARYT